MYSLQYFGALQVFLCTQHSQITFALMTCIPASHVHIRAVNDGVIKHKGEKRNMFIYGYKLHIRSICMCSQILYCVYMHP